MEQLIMRWQNDGTPAKKPTAPEFCKIVAFPDLPNALTHWLDIMQYGLSKGLQGEDYFYKCMNPHPEYREDNTFFIVEGNDPVASVTVICNDKTKSGYIHMVACKEYARGKGYGAILNDIALYVLKSEKMKTAYLTTDDWRIPAIKSYLRAGFTPDRSTEDFVERWDAIIKTINNQK